MQSRAGFNEYLVAFQQKLQSHSERQQYRLVTGFDYSFGWRGLRGMHHESEFIDFINAHGDGAQRCIAMNKELPQLTDKAKQIIDNYGDYEILEELGPAAFNAAQAAKAETNPEIKSNLFQASKYFLKASQGLINLLEKTCSGVKEVGTRVVAGQFTRKVQFVKDLWSNPSQTLYKEVIEPIGLAGYCLGKAAWLACTDPDRLARAGYRTAEAFMIYAQEDPLGVAVALIDMCIDRKLPNIASAAGAVYNVSRKSVNGATALAKQGKVAKAIKTQVKQTADSREIIMGKFVTYEQARNAALRAVGPLGPESKAHYGKFDFFKGKIVGRRSKDGKKVFRLDWDPQKGPHFNVGDCTKGKRAEGIKMVFPFEGDLKLVESLLKQFNK